jgi:hypothetical protein
MSRGSCEWIKDDGEKCQLSADSGFSLCAKHLKQQRKIQEIALKNSKFLGQKPEIETTGMNRLQEMTADRGDGALVVFDADPKKSYKFVRRTSTRRAFSRKNGWAPERATSSDAGGRPVVGESEITAKDHGATYHNQVDEKTGEIIVGDTVLYSMPKEKRFAQIKKAELVSARQCRRIVKGEQGDALNREVPENMQNDVKFFGNKEAGYANTEGGIPIAVMQEAMDPVPTGHKSFVNNYGEPKRNIRS